MFTEVKLLLLDIVKENGVVDLIMELSALDFEIDSDEYMPKYVPDMKLIFLKHRITTMLGKVELSDDMHHVIRAYFLAISNEYKKYWFTDYDDGDRIYRLKEDYLEWITKYSKNGSIGYNFTDFLTFENDTVTFQILTAFKRDIVDKLEPSYTNAVEYNYDQSPKYRNNIGY